MSTKDSGEAIIFAAGDRVQLIAEPPDYAHYALTVGDCGTVKMIDSQQTVHIRWDRGCQVGIIAELTCLLRADES
jgi:Domain of unknown function (DUF4314)